jgi:uncharacterized protein
MPQEPLTVLIKPAGPDCNLACGYCFYAKKSDELFADSPKHRMSDETLRELVRKYMNYHDRMVPFAWQGGEPTLMGLDFFKRAVEYQQLYGRSGQSVSNSLQTNAVLLDDPEWARFLHEYHFLVGASIDGPVDVHDAFRLDHGGQGSHARVVAAIDNLLEHDVEVNILAMVQPENVHRPAETYEYLLGLGVDFLQFIPLAENNPCGEGLAGFTISPEDYGNFLCEIFDMWADEKPRQAYVRMFDDALAVVMGHDHPTCMFGPECGPYFVVEHNGDIYPCDFFVEKQKRLGNVVRDDFATLSAASRYRKFGQKKAEWNKRCSSCQYLEYCSGDCLKQRYQLGENPSALSWLCDGWQKFYGHTLPTFEKLAVSVLNERQAQAPPQARRPVHRLPRRKIGWNDPCYCGSGKKYRECHGAVRAKR